MILVATFRNILVLAVMALSGSVFAEDTSVKLSCQSGKCFLRDKQNLWNIRIEAGTSVEAKWGDTVIGLGEGTAIQIDFSDGTRSYLRNSGLLRIEPGEKKAILAQGSEDPADSALGSKATRANKENIFFIGTFAAKLLSPAVETPILSVKFPLTITAAFRLEGIADEQRALSEWSFFPKGTTPSSEHRIVFRPTEAGSNTWTCDLMITAPGEYVLVPQAILKEGGFAVVVKSDENLESEVQGLLDKALSDPNATFEIRSGQ